MIDYLSFISSESQLFNSAMSSVEAEGIDVFSATPVPTCAGWTAADLSWHLAEVQYFWASIVEGNLTNYSDVVPLERPPDDELVGLQAEQGNRLAGLLAGRDLDEPCWSWHSQGKTVGWVLRRQAHESLIHRVDAELTAQSIRTGNVTTIDEALSEDGVDEMLRVMLDIGTLPSDRAFESSNQSIRLSTAQNQWDLTLGRVVDTSNSGVSDQDAIDLSQPVSNPDAQIKASASEMNLWLWRRGDLPDSAISGDVALVDALRELAEIQ